MSTNKAIRILSVDDHPIVRDGIAATLGRLRQPWGELRAVVNELGARIEE